MAETIEQPAEESTRTAATATSAGTSAAATTSSAASTSVKPAHKPAERPKTLPPWNVVLLDDNQHTYDYVIEMLINICGHSLQRAFRLARGVDRDGRAVIFTAHRELAELKAEQIKGFGLDPRVMSCRSSMAALIEPAE